MTDEQLSDLRYKVGSHLYFSGWTDSIPKGESIFDSVYEEISKEHDIYKTSHHVTVRHRFDVFPEGDGGFFIAFPELVGCMTQADSPGEIGIQAADAYVSWTSAMKDMGNEIPEPGCYGCVE